MSHTGNHEETDPAVLFRSQPGEHAIVVIDRIAGRYRGVVPAVIENQFAAASLEFRQIRIDSIYNSADFFIDNFQITIQIKRAPIPTGTLISYQERAQRYRLRRLTTRDGIPAGFTARFFSGKNNLS